MSHGEWHEQMQPWSCENVSESASGGIMAPGPERQPEEGTSATILNLGGQREGSGVWSYVPEIDHLIELFHSGEQSRFEVISSVTQLLNKDIDPSPQERSQSFGWDQFDPGHSQVQGKMMSWGEILHFWYAKIWTWTRGDGGPEEEESVGDGSSSSSDSDGGEPRKRRRLHQSDMPWSKHKGEISSQNLAALSPPASSGGSITTLNLPNCISNLHLEHHKGYPCLNGNTSSKEKQLILTKSYCHSIASLFIQRGELASLWAWWHLFFIILVGEPHIS